MGKNNSPTGDERTAGLIDRYRSRLGGIVDRREYLKLTGATAATVTTARRAGAAVGVEYDVLAVSPGETLRRTIESGAVLENLLIDVSADGAAVEITARGRDWTIRNVGIAGRCDVAGARPLSAAVSVGGSGLIDNVYLGDGASGDDGIGIRVSPDHAGELMIRRTTVEDWTAGGIRAGPPDESEQGDANGIVRVEDCLVRNNAATNVQLATNGSYVRECVVVADRADVDPGSDGSNADGIRADGVDAVTIERCDVLFKGSAAGFCVVEEGEGSSGLVRLLDSSIDARDGASGRFSGYVLTENVDDDPDLTPPDGAPRSARDAASR